MLISWGIWALDRLRDVLFNTFTTEIIVCKDPTVRQGAQTCGHTRRLNRLHVGDDLVSLGRQRWQAYYSECADQEAPILQLGSRSNHVHKGRHSSMSRRLSWLHAHCIAGRERCLLIGSLCIQVPDIDPFWHAFSLASSSADEEIHLHIGLIGNDWKKKKSGQWKQPKASATWTYKLLEQWRVSVQELAANPNTQTAPIVCKIRGPYGSPFTKCFDPKYKGVIVIGQ